MRITPNSTSMNSIYNLQQGRAKIDQLSEQIGTGANINRPSDDPAGASLLLSINDQINAGDQNATNITKATTSLNVTSTALQTMSSLMLQAKQLAQSMSSGSSDQAALDNAVSQLTTIKQQMVDLGNTKYGDQYVFGGTSNSTPPFISKPGDLTAGAATVSNVDVTGLKPGTQVSGTGIPANTVISSVTVGPPSSFTLSNPATATAVASPLNFYNGDGIQSSINIAQNSTQTLNVTGDRLLKGAGANPSYGTTDVFSSIDALVTALKANDVPGIQAGAKALEDGATQINNAQTDVSLRLARLDSISKMNTNIRNTLETVISNTQTADYAKLGVELTQQQTALSASLAASAKISQMSLLEFLPVT